MPRKATSRYAAVAALIVFVAVAAATSYLSVASSKDRQTAFSRARLSEQLTLRTAGRRNSMMSLHAGRELLNAYNGTAELQRALAQNEALPRSLASADFDEDGVPDLAGGYDHAGRGIVTIHRGNVDSIYPNAPEAQERKINGSFTAAPFLSPALAIEVATAADFLGAGDFDADGHWDLVLASRGGKSFYLLPGDGKGNFRSAKETFLNGTLTAFATGEINRRDGLTDIVAGIDGPEGARALVFEAPAGALRAAPEVLNLPASSTSMAMGQLDDEYSMDLAVAAGNDLLIVHGRDRKPLASGEQRTGVPAAKISTQTFPLALRQLALGDFDGDSRTDIGLLLDDGSLFVSSQPEPLGKRDAGVESPSQWQTEQIYFDRWPGISELVTARVSTAPADDLVLLSRDQRRMHVLTNPGRKFGRLNSSEKGTAGTHRPMSLDVDGQPMAVLPMRLNADALSDLVILRSSSTAPTLSLTGQASEAAANPAGVEYTTFANPSAITVTSGFSPPNAATPYPSTITVSGQAGLVDKARVRLTNLSGSSAVGLDILLVGPAGQKVMLMSDASSCCTISNATITFDDDAEISVSGIRIITGTYKPTDINDGADTFPGPAPAGPYSTTLSTFNGTDPNGTWSLYAINDNFLNSFSGNIAGGWSLYFGPDSPINYVVTNTNDSGAGSLRQAILDANASLGADTISFSIGSGAQTITPASALPNITEAVTIDGTTQPSFAGMPLIEINGVNTGPFSGTLTGLLHITGGRSVVRGLVINQFNNSGIALLNNGNNIIEGNFIGTDVTGTLDRGTGTGISIDTANNLVGGTTAAARNLVSGMSTGVLFSTFNPDLAQLNLVQGNYIGTDITGTLRIANSGGVATRSAPGSPNNTIGGLTAGARNIISGNGTNVDLVYTGSTGNLVQGNYIGPNVNGTASIANNTSTGVSINSGASGNTVGGTTAAARNIISGNLFGGVQIGVSGVIGITNNNLVEGNYIGTNAAGTGALGNGGAGVTIPANANTNLVRNNRIAFNGTDGVQVLNVGGGADTPGIEDEITDNEIYANGDLGIDLGASGITANDLNDPDTGPNTLQNFPVLTDYSFGAPAPPPANRKLVSSAIIVNGTLNSTPNTTFTIHWIFSPDPSCVRNQLPTQPLAFGKIPGVSTNGSGNASFSFPFDFPPGTISGVINCEATDPTGNSSEFSACMPVSATPSISISDVSQTEGNSGTTSFTFNVNLSRTSPQIVTVDYLTANGTATTADNDYVPAGGTLTFNPGELSKPITVLVNGDNKLEPSETFFVNLSNPTNVTIADGQGLGTITNNDSQPTMTINDVSQNEGNTGTTSFGFIATLSNPTYQTVTVNYATNNGTATTSDNDYSTTISTLTFNPGEISKPITVLVNGDIKFEANETYFVNLSVASQATIVDSQGVGTIFNDDTAPAISINDVSQGEGNSGTASFTFTVSLSNPSFQTVAVNYTTANDTAIASGDYQTKSGTVTFTPGDMTKTFFVLVNGDTLNEADETFLVNLSANTNSSITDGQGAGTIINDDPAPSFSLADVTVAEGNSGNINATFTVSLSAASGQIATVQYATADGTAAAGDYESTTGTLTFNPGDTSKPITVVVNGDFVNEPNETFQVNLSNATNATIADNQGLGTITNDDPQPTISINDVAANEGSSGPTSFGFTVSLSNPSSQIITVNYGTADGSGAAGGDYLSASGTLTFNPGDTSKPISVSVNGDALNEADEAFFVNLTGATNATIGDTQGVGAITNDDPLPGLSINDVGVAEGNSGVTNATFTVSLSAASGRMVTVNYGTANDTATVGSDYQSSGGTLTFNPGEITQPIVVVVNGDTANELDETFFVNLSGATNANIADTQGIGTILNDDGAPTLAINDVTVTEGHSGTTSATFTISLSPASGQTVTVQYATANGTAAAGSDYQGANGTVTFDPGDTSEPVTVLVDGDLLNEPGETYFVNLANSTNAAIVDNQGMGTIANDDPVPQLNVNNISLAEGNVGAVNASFTVSLTAASAQIVTVNYATAEDTATTGSDYQSASGTLTFNPGDMSKPITVPVNGDLAFESDETFLVNLTAPINATIGDGQGQGTILNDDSQPAISINDISQGEGNSGTTSFTFTVSLSNPSSQTITVNYATANGTATTANNDYSPTSGTTTFDPGDTSKSITVLVNGDALNESDETFVVDLSGAANAAIAVTLGGATIINDDGAPSLSVNDVTVTEGNSGPTDAVFTVTLSAPSGQTVTVNYAAAEDTASAASDYQSAAGTLTFDPGQTSKPVTVVVNGDTAHEPDETFFVNLSGVANATIADDQGVGTITNNDPLPGISINDVITNEGNSGTASFSFIVTLSNPSSQSITVNYATADGTASTGSDYQNANGTLTFNPGDTSQPVNVPVNGDTFNELNETFVVNLSNQANASLTDDQGLGTISNDDAVPSLSIGDVGVAEGNSGTTNATFNVTLSAPSGRTVTVQYSTANGTAIVGSDYQSASGTLTFDPGDDIKSITVLLDGDTANEPHETFFVNLSSETNATIADTQGLGTILNDDGEPALAINNVQVTEGNAGTTSATFTVSLSPASGQTVTVNYATDDGTTTAGSDYQSTTGSLIFAPGEISKSITVPIHGDALNEADETFFVNLSSPGNATILDGQGVGMIENDDPLPQLSINNLALAEGNGGTTNAIFTVNMSAVSGRTVMVNFATADDTGAAGSDYQSAIGALTFNPGEASKTITVPVNGDTTFEPDETFFVNLSTPANAGVGDAQGQGTISNDDSQPEISINDLSQSEGNSGTTPFNFAVTLSNPSSQIVTVIYATGNGTATVANSDYTSASDTLTFNPGEMSKPISVAVNGDALNEPNETFFVNLSGAVNAGIADNQGAGTITNDDAMPGLSITDVSVAEGNSSTTNATFAVTLSAPSGQIVTVGYATADGTPTATATAPGDYQSQTGTLTFNPGDTSKLITVLVNGDTVNEPNETFSVNLSGPVNATIADIQGTGTINNDDPVPGISINDVALNEGNSGTASLTFAVTLSNASSQVITVNYGTAPGTAAAGGDYLNASSTLTFNPGDTSESITVLVNGDTANELNETFFVNLSSAANASITDNQGLGTITNDDALPALSINDVGVAEGNSGTSSATFTVTLSPASGRTVTVQYATADGTGNAGSDYQNAGSSLIFNPGETSKSLTVPVNGDTANEPNETFFVNLSNAPNATIADNQGAGTILNDDGTPTLAINDVTITEGNSGTSNATFNVSLSPTSGQTVTVQFATADNTALAGSDYQSTSGPLTFNPGDPNKSVTVLVNGDALNEPDETFFVNLSNAGNATIVDSQGLGTVTNNDPLPGLSINDIGVMEGNSGSVGALFTVTLSAASAQTVTVNFATADGTATAGSDYQSNGGALTFSPGETSKPVTVMVNGDTTHEADETFLVNLSGVANATISDSQAVGTILNDDTAPGYTPPGNNVTVQGSGVDITFSQVSVAGTTTMNSIPPASAGTTPGGYVINGSSVAFEISTTAAYTPPIDLCFAVPSVTDPGAFSLLALLHNEGGVLVDRTVSRDFATKKVCGRVTSLSPFVVASKITVQFSQASYSKPETGPSTNITVTRTGDTSGPASVNFSTGNNSYVACNQATGVAVQNCDFILSSGTLNFAAGQASRSFPIIIIDDLYVEGTETISLTLSGPSSAVLGTQSAATLTLTDNDSVAPTTNPLDDPTAFVTQHYYDFLGRQPDDDGRNYWVSQITICAPTDTACINERRVAVSNAFFFEQEYQQTASYVFLLYRAAYGSDQPSPNPDFFDTGLSTQLRAEAKKLPRYLSFVRDRAQVVGGSNLAQTQLALANAFVQRTEFTNKYLANLTGPEFVDAVLATIQTGDGATLAAADRNALITHFNNGGRGLVMFHLANDYWNGCERLPGSPAAPCVPAGFGAAVDNRPFIDAEYTRSFVYSQYSGYLRRDGDIGGFLFWLNQVSKSPPRNVPRQRAMVCSFMTSTEYQQRLSPVATHSNAECPPPP